MIVMGVRSGSGLANTRIVDRESDYLKRRLSSTIHDNGMNYNEVMVYAMLERDIAELMHQTKKDFLDDNGNLKQAPVPNADEEPLVEGVLNPRDERDDGTISILDHHHIPTSTPAPTPISTIPLKLWQIQIWPLYLIRKTGRPVKNPYEKTTPPPPSGEDGNGGIKISPRALLPTYLAPPIPWMSLL